MIPAKYWSPTKKLMLLGAMAGGKAVEDTATGNPLTFLTDLARPLKSLLIPFAPKQEGTGDPSPSNIRPIVPWSGLTVWNGGKNLFNKDTAVTGVWWKGNILTSASYTNYKASDKIPVLPNVQYVLTRQSTQQGAVCYFDKNKQYIDQQTWDRYTPSRVIPDGVYYVSFTVEAEYIDSAQFEVGQTATAYEPYKPITDTDIVFPSPVYGGYVDMVTGEVWAEYAEYTFTGNEGFDRTHNTQGTPADEGYFFLWAYDWQGFLFDNWNVGHQDVKVDSYPVYNNLNYWYSGIRKGDKSAWTVASYQGVVFRNDSCESADAFKELITGTKMTYKYSTPVLITTLTPQQITALIGNNTLWSDANEQMTAVFFKKG